MITKNGDHGCLAATGWVPFEVEVDGATLGGAIRDAPGPSLLYLHGLGSSHDDIATGAPHAGLAGYRVVAVDLPGHRSSRWHRRSESDAVRACVDLLEQFVTEYIGGELAIVGHSLGGAIGVLLADRLGGRCRGLIDIEGNLVASDCGALSRPTASRDDWDRDGLFRMIDDHLPGIPNGGTEAFLSRYRANVTDHREWIAYTQSLIAHSADGSLLDRFVGLRCHRSYIYGADDPPEVIEQLAALGVPTTPIAGSGHWPMYARPDELHGVIARDLQHAFGE